MAEVEVRHVSYRGFGKAEPQHCLFDSAQPALPLLRALLRMRGTESGTVNDDMIGTIMMIS